MRRALSPIASPRCAAGTHWLTIMAAPEDHVSPSRSPRQRLVERRPVHPQLLELLGRVELLPEVERHVRRRRGAARRGSSSTKPSRVPSKSLARSRSTAASCRRRSRPAARRRQDGVHQRRHVDRVLVVEQHAAAVHRRRNRRGRVGEHRHLLVERFDERHAEALVFARAQEQVGDVVVGDQLLVRRRGR